MGGLFCRHTPVYMTDAELLEAQKKYKEIKRTTEQNWLTAFSSSEYIVWGYRLRSLTLRDDAILRDNRSCFFGYGEITAKEIITTISYLYVGKEPLDFEDMGVRLAVDSSQATSELLDYFEKMYSSGVRSWENVGGKRSSFNTTIADHIAYKVINLKKNCHFTEDEVLNMPLPRLWQYSNVLIQCSSADSPLITDAEAFRTKVNNEINDSAVRQKKQ